MSKKSRPGDGIRNRGRKGMGPIIPLRIDDSDESNAISTATNALKGFLKLKGTEDI